MKFWMKLLPLSMILTAVVSAPSFADEDYEKASEYLSEYYNVSPFTSEEATAELVNEALTAIGGEAVLVDESLDEEAVVAEGIRIAGLEELALTYDQDKAQKILESVSGGSDTYTEEYAPYVACAVDQGLLSADEVNEIESFLYRCLEIGGAGRHYIGRISDDDILSVVQSDLASMDSFSNETLTNLGDEIVLSGVTTGYSLMYSNYDAHFLEDYTLNYGHSDYQHAVQLIGLLKSEGFDGYLQIEPKVSVYEYMLDWGEPSAPTPTYAVRQVTDDRYLCYAVEYNLMIEFDTKEEKEAFHDLIETYAKKYDDRVDEDGNVTANLLAGSWWQPLYSSTTEMENEDFGELVDNVVYNEDGTFSIHSYSLPENCEAFEEKVTELTPDLTVNHVAIHVDPAFMNYITGDDYQ